MTDRVTAQVVGGLFIVAWWEPILAVAFTFAAIAGLIVFAGRVYTGAILHSGATLKLRDAWRGTTARERGTPATEPGHGRTDLTALQTGTGVHSRRTDRATNALLVGVAGTLGAAVFALAHDFVIGLAVGAGFYAVASRIMKARFHAAR